MNAGVDKGPSNERVEFFVGSDPGLTGACVVVVTKKTMFKTHSRKKENGSVVW